MRRKRRIVLPEQNALWIASFPKAGNTWVASVLAAAGCDFGYSKGKYDAYHLEASGEDPKPCDALDRTIVGAECSILKTHAHYAPSGLPHRFKTVVPVSAGYIHIFRNPLDVLLSYIGFTRLEYAHRPHDIRYQQRLFVDLLGFDKPIAAEQWRECGIDAIPRPNLDHALDAYSRNGISIVTIEEMCGSWISHLRSWRAAADALPGCALRYEDCLADAAAFAPLANLLTIGTGRIIESVAKVNRHVAKASSGDSERDRIFFNKRKAYYFHGYFSHQAIDRFFSEHEGILIEAGYGSLVGKPCIANGPEGSND